MSSALLGIGRAAIRIAVVVEPRTALGAEFAVVGVAAEQLARPGRQMRVVLRVMPFDVENHIASTSLGSATPSATTASDSRLIAAHTRLKMKPVHSRLATNG